MDFAPQTPEIDENDENGGCHPDKMTVCQKHRFDNQSKMYRMVAQPPFMVKATQQSACRSWPDGHMVAGNMKLIPS